MGRACGPLECSRAGRPPYLASAGAADQGGAQGRRLGFAADGLVRPYRCPVAVGAMGQGLAGPLADDQDPALHAGACGQVQRSARVQARTLGMDVRDQSTGSDGDRCLRALFQLDPARRSVAAGLPAPAAQSVSWSLARYFRPPLCDRGDSLADHGAGRLSDWRGAGLSDGAAAAPVRGRILYRQHSWHFADPRTRAAAGGDSGGRT
ncbi:hypothetical protein SDC9_146025 [bioreactor metagenome]|uniref:Uncharacterized protein n=1 Tax=bioreactor metagenome TaxID=1076179 RepID=A0A645EBH0_9ZZZZ